MTETVPIAATRRFHEAAHAQDIAGFEINPPDVAKLIEITGRHEDIAVEGLSLAMARGIGWRLERGTPLLYDAAAVSLESQPVSLPEHTTHIRINLSHGEPITEAVLSRHLASHLLIEPRRRNMATRFTPGLLSEVGAAAIAIPGIMAWHDQAHPALTWSLTAAFAGLMAAGIPLIRNYQFRERQFEMAEFGGAPVLRPIIVHRKLGGYPQV